MKVIKAPRLKKGDKIGVVSPSMPVLSRLEAFKKAIKLYEKEWGVKVVVGDNALKKQFYSAGTPEERLADFHKMIADPEIRAIFFSVGGNSAIDLVDRLDYQLIRKNPKIIAGISDATTLLNPITAKTGLITFLGLEFTRFGKNNDMGYSMLNLRKTLFDGKVGQLKMNSNWKVFDGFYSRYSGWRAIRPSKAQGRLVGGTLSCFRVFVNTEYIPELDGSILFFEAYKLPKKVIHHGMRALRLNGVFDKISGIVVGFCLDSDNPEVGGNERDMKDVMLEVTEGYDFPIMEIGEIGHKVENFLQPIGARATIDADRLEFSIDERVVV